MDVEEPRRSSAGTPHGMDRRKLGGKQFLAHPFLIVGSVAFRKLPRRSRQFGRSHVVGGRIDEIARHLQRLGRDPDEVLIRIRWWFQTRRAFQFARPIAFESVGAVHETQAQLRRFGVAPLLRKMKPARRQAFGESGRMPQRQPALTFPEAAHCHFQGAVRIRHQQHPMLFTLEVVLVQPCLDERRPRRAPRFDLILIQQPQGN